MLKKRLDGKRCKEKTADRAILVLVDRVDCGNQTELLDVYKDNRDAVKFAVRSWGVT